MLDAKMGGIALRTVQLMVNQGLITAMDEGEYVANESGCGLNPSTWYLAIPDDYPLAIGDGDFIEDEMCRLYCRGRYDGLHGLWHDLPFHPSAPPQCLSVTGKPTYPVGDTLADSSCPVSGGAGVVCPTSYPAPVISTWGHCDPQP